MTRQARKTVDNLKGGLGFWVLFRDRQLFSVKFSGFVEIPNFVLLGGFRWLLILRANLSKKLYFCVFDSKILPKTLQILVIVERHLLVLFLRV